MADDMTAPVKSLADGNLLLFSKSSEEIFFFADNSFFRSALYFLPKNRKRMIIPVIITIYADRSFSFIMKTPPAPVLIKKACGIETASGAPNKNKVASLTKAQVEEIAKVKMPDLNAASLEAAMSMIAGTARSMGITVKED